MSHNYQQPANPSLYGGGGSGSGSNYYDPNADFSAAISQARHQRRYEKGSRPTPPTHDEDDDGEDSDPEDTSFFSKAIGFLSEHKDKLGREDVDEEKVVNAHQTLYGGSGGSDDGGKKHDAEFLGGGAAMQALKMFMDSGSGGDGEKKGKAGGNDQNKLIGMAMAQAGKLWEKDNKEGKAVCFFFFTLFIYVFSLVRRHALMLIDWYL